jgi:hypothetical protein
MRLPGFGHHLLPTVCGWPHGVRGVVLHQSEAADQGGGGDQLHHRRGRGGWYFQTITNPD